MRYLILTLLLAACGSGSGQEPHTPETGVIVGGSIMRDLPLISYQGVTLTNLAIGGQTCIEAIAPLLKLPPQGLVLLNCGHNRFNPDAYRTAINRAVTWAQSTDSRLILLNLSPIPAFPERAQEIQELNAWTDSLPIEVYDFNEWASLYEGTEAFKRDGLHLTTLGYESLVAELFYGEPL